MPASIYCGLRVTGSMSEAKAHHSGLRVISVDLADSLIVICSNFC
jgi:hypothetical protein